MTFKNTATAQPTWIAAPSDLLLVGKNGPKFCTSAQSKVEKWMKVFASPPAEKVGFLEGFARHLPKTPLLFFHLENAARKKQTNHA